MLNHTRALDAAVCPCNCIDFLPQKGKEAEMGGEKVELVVNDNC